MSSDGRITFRPTKEMNDKIEAVMRSGKYLKKSDLIRDAIWRGLEEIEKGMKYGITED